MHKLSRLIQAALLEVLERISPQNVANYCSGDLAWLMNKAQQLGNFSPAALGLLQRLANPKPGLTADLDQSIWEPGIQGINEWLVKFGGTPITGQALRFDDGPQRSPAARTEDGSGSLPPAWVDLVPELRRRLSQSRPPFDRWNWAMSKWRRRWVEAFWVTPADDRDLGAWILVPTEEAASSLEAQRSWTARLAAAQTLIRHDNQPYGSRVLATETATGRIVLRLPEYIQGSLHQLNTLNPRVSIECGIALCDVLAHFNRIGVRLHDLSPEWIAFESEPARRFTAILDPTAVVPDRFLMPEWRNYEHGLSSASLPDDYECSQVFLIAGLTLCLLLDRTDALTKEIPFGHSATIAYLSGLEQLANDHPSRVQAILTATIRERCDQYDFPLDAALLAEIMCRSLAEKKQHRFSELSKLQVALQSVRASAH